MPTLFRYPGGKSRMSGPILKQLNLCAERYDTFCDVACGGASIGLLFAEQHRDHKIIFNDYDSGIADLWGLVVNDPKELIIRIKKFKPTARKFYIFQRDLAECDCKDRGFKQLVIHQISYSGLGRRAGSPIGGKEQKGEYAVGCRWNPDYLVLKINKFHELLYGRTKVLNRSMFSILPKRFLFYVDPPYYGIGHQLYVHDFSIKQHDELASQLKKMNKNWVLSYNNCLEIKKLYGWAKLEQHRMTYSIMTGSGNGANVDGAELIIMKK